VGVPFIGAKNGQAVGMQLSIVRMPVGANSDIFYSSIFCFSKDEE